MSWLLNGVKTDCRFYVGEKPCEKKRTCPTCPHYSPMGVRVLVLKLGAAGDALRTTPMLRLLEKAHGQCHVTWATDKVSYELLRSNPLIDKLVLVDWKTSLWLAAQKFDLVYSVDKDPAALALANQVQADKKLGYCLTETGTLSVFTEAGTYALYLGLSDPLKFRRNDRTYQDFTFEMLELPYAGQRYVFNLTEDEKDAAQKKLDEIGAAKKPLIGLNTGAGPVFATKKWPADRFEALARRLAEDHGGTVLLLGGPDEVERNKALKEKLGDLVVDAGCDNPLRVFAGMVAELAVLVTGDTLAMHLAIAEEIPTVALFGPTAPAEVTLYDKGVKLTGQPECAPCYKAVCKEKEDRACLKEITVDQVAEAVAGLL